jgi:hypothetical protein
VQHNFGDLLRRHRFAATCVAYLLAISLTTFSLHACRGIYHKSMSSSHFECVRATLLQVAQPWLHSDPGMLYVVMVGKGEMICELRSCGGPQFSAPLVIAEHPFTSRSTKLQLSPNNFVAIIFPYRASRILVLAIRFSAAFRSENVYSAEVACQS